YLLVPFWDIGTTEIGSSGGPLFNKDGLVVGSLHGGLATCTSKSYDKFGWFAYSWEGGLTNSTQLKYWLDPIGEAPIQLEGREGRKCKLNIAPNNFSASICLQDTATYSFDLNQYFQENTQFDILQLPSSLGFEWGNNGARANETVELKLFTTDELESGRYFLPIQAVSEGETLTTFIELIVSNTSPLPVEPILPLNQQREISINPLFSWKSGNQDASFKIQLSEDSLFNTIFLEEENLDTTAFELNSDLPPGTVFYWRVQAFNLCGDAFWSTVRSFRTAEIVCSTITSENVPIEISTQGTPTITSAITISEPGQVNQVSVLNLQIDHTFVGDLAAALTSPSGTVVRLFDRPGVPASFAGCGGENLRLDFYDDATFTPNRIETFCGNLPAISGAHQALDPFSVFNNEPVQGDWILTITDNANQDGGNLISWSLDICASRSNGISLITPEVILENCIVNTLIFPLYIGEGFNADGVDLSINGLPEEAAINFTRNPAFPGDTVLISIANIQNVGKYLIEVSGNDNNGNIVIAPVQINQTDSPTAPIPLAPDNEEVISSLTPFFQWQADPLATTYSFELDDGDDFENPIVNTQLLEPSFFMQNPLRAGIYYWRISINNGCGTETSEIQSFIVSNTTSNNNLIPSGFKLYPNPAQNLINIELGKLTTDVFWKIYNTNGQEIKSGEIQKANRWTTEIQDLNSGIHFIQIVGKEINITYKIVKK
ncbi:MAG: proprotein convertase P-domain-containing protein, partial [Bacteroidota bacterium]